MWWSEIYHWAGNLLFQQWTTCPQTKRKTTSPVQNRTGGLRIFVSTNYWLLHKTAGFIFWIRHARHIKPPVSRISVFKHKKTNILLDVRFKCWRQPIVPGRCQPSIFSTNELNFCVRYGNRWTLVVINTNYSVCRLIWRLCYNTTSILKLQAFFQKNFKKFWKTYI